MRLAAAAAALITALVLVLGTAAAYADPSFVLTESAARAGDVVHFSISGTEGGASYGVEIADREVAEGSVPAGSGVAGGFTMPDLGDASRTVTVEAKVTESDETTTFARPLQYLAPSQAGTGASGTEPPLLAPPAPSVQRAPAAAPKSQTPARKRRPSRRPASKRRAHRSPTSTRRQRSSRGVYRSSNQGTRVSAPLVEASAAHASSQPSGDGELPAAGRGKKGSPSERSGGLGAGLATPTTSSIAPAVLIDDRPGIPTAVVVVLTLEALVALALLSASVARRRRPGLDAEDGDDEVLRGVVYVPGSSSSARSKRPR